MNSSITSYQAQALTSLKQVLNMSMMQKALKQDAQSVQGVLEAMPSVSAEPHKGQNIDIKI